MAARDYDTDVDDPLAIDVVQGTNENENELEKQREQKATESGSLHKYCSSTWITEKAMSSSRTTHSTTTTSPKYDWWKGGDLGPVTSSTWVPSPSHPFMIDVTLQLSEEKLSDLTSMLCLMPDDKKAFYQGLQAGTVQHNVLHPDKDDDEVLDYDT